MRNIQRALIFTALLAIGTVGALSAGEADQHTWKCPPCGQDHCALEFDKPGACEYCGMQLVRSDELAERTKTVAILVFNGVQPIDFTGPLEVFGFAHWNVYTVAKSVEPVATAWGFKITPQYDFSNCPAPDLIVVPGGRGLDFDTDPAEMAWLQKMAPQTPNLMSVCNGAVSIGIAGLLENLRATTHHSAFAELKRRSPSTTIVKDKKWVDNGKVITAAGLSSGIDAALYLVSRFNGAAEAHRIAEWLEYRWVADES